MYRLFNPEPSKSLKTPLEKNDHPELDTSDILEGQQVNRLFDYGRSTSMAHNIWEDLTYNLRSLQCLDFMHNQDK